MKHLLLLAAFIFGAQPLLAGVSAPNGATLLALLIVAAWGWLVCSDLSSAQGR